MVVVAPLIVAVELEPITTELRAIALEFSPMATAPPAGCEPAPSCIKSGKKGFCQSKIDKLSSFATEPLVATPAPVPVVEIVF